MFSAVVNELSIHLSNDAMVAGLILAKQRGCKSLEALIEQLLVERRSAGERVPSPSRVDVTSQSPTKEAALSADAGFRVNPPALTLEAPTADPPAELVEPELAGELPLPFLTNRLSPLKASVRALANLAVAERGWPRLRDFQAKAGHAARECGLQLVAQDRELGRRGREKRSVAWPIGPNPATALERFVFAFTVADDGGRATGPLAMLGLVNLVDGRVALTVAGWALACAHSPVLDGDSGTIGDDESTILRDQLASASPERKAIAEFVRAVQRAAGAQSRIDELLATWHAEWSTDQAAAQRSAMIGRLEELRVLEVQGRGTKAIVRLRDVEAFEDDMTKRSAA